MAAQGQKALIDWRGEPAQTVSQANSAALSSISGNSIQKIDSASKKKLLFAPNKTPQNPEKRPWKLLIVDDEPEVHSVTRLSLSDFRFKGRNLEFISAYSGEEAKNIAQQDPEIAVILLDVVMETDDAGLNVVEYIRRTLGNNFVRIILRTGQPGLAPERRVIQAYDINDYRAKSELTQDRMFSIMHTSLSAYQHLTSLARNQRHLTALADEYVNVLARLSNRVKAPTDLQTDASQALRKELEQQTPEELRHHWSRMEDSSNRLQGLAEALHRLSDGEMISTAGEEFSGSEVIEQALETLQPLMQETGYSVEADEFPRMQGYREPFKQMIEHLLRNALQHHENENEAIKLSIKSDGQYWKISVADRGRGVPADRRDEIFEAFTGSPKRTSVASEGLGLVLCRRIAARHGGRIWVEARPGGGSIFICKIPAQGSFHELR